MSFTINKLSFFNSFQFLSSSLDSLVKKLNKDDFEYLSQEFDNNLLDRVKHEVFILMSIWVILKSLRRELPRKEKLLREKLMTENMNMFLIFGKKMKWKLWNIVTTCI